MTKSHFDAAKPANQLVIFEGREHRFAAFSFYGIDRYACC
jgi:hypothetical protein